MILDKVVEKKDIKAFCDFRRKHLANQMYLAMKTAPSKRREYIKQKFKGRIMELGFLVKNLNSIKKASQNECKRYHETKVALERWKIKKGVKK